MNIGGGSALGGVRKQLNALPVLGGGGLHGHGRYGVAVLNKGRGKKFELAGKILVNKENVHERRKEKEKMRLIMAWRGLQFPSIRRRRTEDGNYGVG